MDANRTIEREALGRIATLGDLYDARSDKFSGFKIFKTRIPEDAISSTDNPFMEIVHSMSDSLEDKFKKMDISGEISVSILGGLVKGTGSASYLSDKKDSARSVRCTLYYKSKTKTESLNIYFDELTDAVSTKALENTEATHVVAGISWGANATITFDYDNEEKLDRQEIEGAFQAHVKMIALAVDAKAKVNLQEGTLSKNINFKIHAFADINPPDETQIPSTPEEAMAFLKKMPTHVKTANDGKGRPLTYKLVPLSIVQKRFSMECKVDRVLVSLAEHFLIDFIHLFDELSEAMQRLSDLCSDMKSHKFCVCEKDSQKANDAEGGFKKTELMLRSSLAKTLVEFRSNKAGSDKLNELLSENVEGPNSAKEINKLVDSFDEVTGKISFADFLLNQGVTYIGRGTLFESELRKNMKGTVYILFFGSEDMNCGVWRKYQRFFTDLIKPEKTDAKKVTASDLETFLAVDLDLRKDVAETEKVGRGIRICKYINDEYISCDLLADEGQKPIPTSPDMDWKVELLRGITCVPLDGTPGRIEVFGLSAKPILTGINKEDILIAAAQFNKGRVVVISADGYGTDFNNASSKYKKLRKNVKRWVSSGTFDGDECILNANCATDKNKLNSCKIVIWVGGPGEISTGEILEFISNGGGFVHCMNPWGWLQQNSGKKLREMPYWEVLLSAGVRYNDQYIQAYPSGFLIEQNKA